MSSLRKFNYVNSKGEKQKHIICALSETPEYLMGIDVNSLIKTIIDNNDKDFTVTKESPHSLWSTKNYVEVRSSVSENMFCDPNISLFEIVNLRKKFEESLKGIEGEIDINFNNFLIFYNINNDPVNVELLKTIIKENDISDNDGLIEFLKNCIEDKNNKFNYFATNHKWFSYVGNNIPIPGFKEIESLYDGLKNIFEYREPTQYQSLQESRSSEKKPIEGFDESWMKAFRNFKKSGISNLEG